MKTDGFCAKLLGLSLVLAPILVQAEVLVWDDSADRTLLMERFNETGRQVFSLAPKDLDSVTGNEVTIDAPNNEINGKIYGAFSEDKDVSDNKLTIKDGTVGSHMHVQGGHAIFGGYSLNGQATNNTVEILGGNPSGYINGGFSQNNTAQNNKVIVRGGKINAYFIIGGNSQSKDTTNNEVEIFGGEFIAKYATNVNGGSSMQGGNAINNRAILHAGDITDITGGDGKDGASKNMVQISGGTIKFNTRGGHSFNGDANDNIVIVTGGEMSNIRGGNSNHKMANGNSIEISGGTAIRDIYGGEAKMGASNNTIRISGGTLTTGGQYWRVIGGYSQDGEVSKNSVMISGGVVQNGGVYGGYGWGDTVPVTENSVHIAGGTINGNIVGGSAYITKNLENVTNNTVTIMGTPDITNARLWGRYVDSGAIATTTDKGNTLNFYSKNLSAKNIANFDNINFYLSGDTKANQGADGKALLVLTESKDTDITKAKVGVGVMNGQAPDLKKDDRINLLYSQNANIKHPTDLSNNINVLKGISKVYTFVIKGDEKKYLYAVVDGSPTPPTPSYDIYPKTKSLLEAKAAQLAFVDLGGELVSSSGVKAMNSSTAALYHESTFAAIGGSDIRYNTGSHVDIKGVNFLAGISKELDPLTYGVFFEAGKGSYDSYNNFGASGVARGDGDSSYYGLGLLLHSDLLAGFYFNSSLRVGKSKTSYNSSDFMGTDVNFDTNKIYYGAHIGGGNIIKLNESSNLDIYAKAFYTRVGSDDVTIRGDKISFEALNSFRTKLGTRYTYDISSDFSVYGGVALEREFSGKAAAYNHAVDKNIDSPSLKGNSGVFELGTTLLNTKALNIDANLQGYVGKKEGVGGGVKLEYKF